MKRLIGVLIFMVFTISMPGYEDVSETAAARKWLRTARVAAPDDIWTEMTTNEIADFIDELAAQNVNTVDIDVSYAANDEQVSFVRKVLAYAHDEHPGMRFFVYQAPLEIVSENVDMNADGKVDAGRSSVFSRHPEWAQRSLSGEPAVFYGSEADAFWVDKHDEDLWLCPNDPEYAQVWRSDLKAIAATGVDGIYIDVPFLRGWYDDSREWGWACACSDCAAQYRDRFGVNPPNSARWSDPNFRRFIRWRYEQIEEFIKTIRAEIRSVHPSVALIIEHWDGVIDSVETGCDPAMLRSVSDARTHEWIHNDSASNYHSYTWLEDAVRYLYYLAVDDGQPTWILGYSDEDDTEAMQSLAALQLTAGFNFWETDEPDMAGSVDKSARTSLFKWISKNRKLYYRKKTALLADTALFFSRNSIVFGDYRHEGYSGTASEEFLGVGMMLLQQHVPFKVVTSLEGSSLSGVKMLVLPYTCCLSNAEAQQIRSFIANGGKVIATGETGEYDEEGNARRDGAIDDVFDGHSAIINRSFPGQDYYNATAPWDERPDNRSKAESKLTQFKSSLLDKVDYEPFLTTDADEDVVIFVFKRRNLYYLRLFDAGGDSRRNVEVRLELPAGTSVKSAQCYEYLEDGKIKLTIKTDGNINALDVPVRKHTVAILKVR